MSFVSQFGEKLVNPSTSTEVSPEDALSGKDHVMLYFSAHWCPPCRRFTPELIKFYNKIKSEHKVELVFCSLDNSESDYKDYISDMPWLCMPFEAPETKIMAKKYKASGIPHLVVLDGTGEVITMDGTDGVREDEGGKNFPWKPKSFQEIWPEKILVSKGEGEDDDTYLSSSTLKDKYLMLYFSASWCPPCRAFTPTLSKAYTKLKSLHKNLELAFVSSDRDENSFNDYFEKMSFCALPYVHRDAKSALSKMFEVSGIPTLVMLGPENENGERELINGNVRGHIESESFDEFPFYKKNYGDVENGAEGLNDTKSLVIFHENGDDDEQDNIKEVCKKVAEVLNEKNGGEAFNVYWSFSSNGIGSRIRELTKLPTAEESEDASMILLDIPDDGGFYNSPISDITVENVIAFTEEHGDRQQLS